jgi:hypothetical protein
MTAAVKSTQSAPAPRKRREKNREAFTDLSLWRLNVKKRLDALNAERRKAHREQGLPMSQFKEATQDLIWDAGCRVCRC